MSGRNYPKGRYYVGRQCPRCQSPNTVAEVYRFSTEGYCLSCTRNFDLTPLEVQNAKRKANDTAPVESANTELQRVRSPRQV